MIHSLFSFRTLTTEHNSNSNDSIDDAVEKDRDKRPQYKNIMNNIRRGIRTDEEGTSSRKVDIISKPSQDRSITL